MSELIEPAVAASAAAPASAPSAAAPAPPAVPALALSDPEEVPLTAEQRGYFERQASIGALVKRAVETACATPLILAMIVWKITKLVARVPLIGWLLGIYGLIATVGAVLVGIVAIPFVALLLLPTSIFSRRPKLRGELAGGVGIRQQGTFKVTKDSIGGGGTVITPTVNLELNREEMEKLSPALIPADQDLVLDGAIVRSASTRILLGAFDGSGAQLTGVAA